MKKFVRRAMAVALAAAMMVLSMGNTSVAQAAGEAATLDISTRVLVNGADPVNNADGSVTFSGQATMKSSFALPQAVVAGDSIKVNVKLKFDSEADAAVRFYLIANGTDVNSATGIEVVENGGVGTVVEKSFSLTAAADSTELLLASASYGVLIDNVTVYEITLGDKVAEEPAVEEPKAEEPAVEEPKVEEPAVEEPKAEEPAVEEPKAEEPAVEEPKVEEPAVEEPKAEEPAVEEPKTEEPAVEEPKTEEPAVEVTAGEYVVKSGDTLGKIAAAYGLVVKDLVDANNIENADLIKVGAKLAIPTVDTAKRHIVVAGDTLGKIAKANGYTVAQLVSANGIENADLIKVGQLIVLP